MKDQCMFCDMSIDREKMVEIFDQNGKTVMVCPDHNGVLELHNIWLTMLKDSRSDFKMENDKKGWGEM